MFIQTEILSDPDIIKFLPGEKVLEGEVVTFSDPTSATRSPLASRLFDVEGVSEVVFGDEFIQIRKDQSGNWQLMKPEILGAIMEHYVAGLPMISDEDEIAEDFDEVDADIVQEIKDLLETRVRPAITEGGGNSKFRGYRDGKVIVELLGSAYSYRTGIENLLRHYVAEFAELVDFRDSKPKPGLKTPEGMAVQQLLDERINPSVAMHGGRIALVDVQADTAYIRLEGGCQGCGMADVTLKQGVEVEIKKEVPSIAHVLDVTDHDGGANPYYQPGK